MSGCRWLRNGIVLPWLCLGGALYYSDPRWGGHLSCWLAVKPPRLLREGLAGRLRGGKGTTARQGLLGEGLKKLLGGCMRLLHGTDRVRLSLRWIAYIIRETYARFAPGNKNHMKRWQMMVWLYMTLGCMCRQHKLMS